MALANETWEHFFYQIQQWYIYARYDCCLRVRLFNKIEYKWETLYIIEIDAMLWFEPCFFFSVVASGNLFTFLYSCSFAHDASVTVLCLYKRKTIIIIRARQHWEKLRCVLIALCHILCKNMFLLLLLLQFTDYIATSYVWYAPRTDHLPKPLLYLNWSGRSAYSHEQEDLFTS